MMCSVAKMIYPMKQFFSYLGASLAAIAALASCNKEIDAPVEDLKGGVPFEICASTADTKTAIDGAFKTTWVVGETPDSINVYHKLASDAAYTHDGKFLAETEKGKFSGTLTPAPEAGKEYQWLAHYPYDSYLSTPAAGYSYIGSRSDGTQSQKGLNSVAHLCGKYMPLVGKGASVGTATPTIAMKHASSVLEINVANNTEEALDVTSITFTAPESIIGQFVIDYTGETTTYTEKKYASAAATLSVTDGTIAPGASGKFYIAIKPFTVSSGVLKVAVNGYEKEITISNETVFAAGKIKKINFNNDVIQTTYTWDLSVNSTSEASAERIAWTNSVANMVCTQAKGGTAANNYYPGKGESSTRFYKNSTLSITPKTGKSLTYYVFEATTEGYASALANSAWTNAEVVVDGTTVTVLAKDPIKAVSAVIGATCGFTRVECHTDEAPVFAPIINANPTSINVPAAGNVCTINYSIDFSVDGKSISATSDQDWVNSFDYSTTGEITFIVDSNSGDARTATITLSYDGAENATITVAQKSASPGETVTYTALFGASYNSKKVQDYTSTWSATNADFKVDLVNWNNNQNGWDWIKAGSKKAASVATITTNAAIAEAITKVVITIDEVTTSSINSITLYCGDSANACETSLGTFTIATGEQSVTITSPTSNKFYKISADCKKASNGTLTVSKVVYTKE